MTEKTYDLFLDKFIYGGEAMGRLPDGRAVFVPYTLPGERARIRLVEEKKGFARGELLEILEPSPERIAPKCPHFGACVGCHYQHLPYEAQLRAKEAIMRDQLERIGKIENPPVEAIIPSPAEWRYLQEANFRFGQRIKENAHMPDILAVEECHLLSEAINEFWEELEFGENEYFSHLSFREDAGGNLMFIFHAQTPETPEMILEDDLSVVHIVEGEAIIMGGDDHIVTMLHERPFRVSPTSYLHPNRAVAEKMIDELLKRLPLNEQITLIELHSGVGSFSAFLAERVGRLVCVEKSPAACDDFSINLDEFENVKLYEAQAMEVLPALDFTPDILLADPPAGGLGRHTLDGIVKLAPPLIAYLSRDPSTLARDAKRLFKGGYRLKIVQPFDAAPQQAEISSLSFFEK